MERCEQRDDRPPRQRRIGRIGGGNVGLLPRLQFSLVTLALSLVAGAVHPQDLQRLPGLQQDLRLTDGSAEIGPQVLAVSPSGRGLWIAGVSGDPRTKRPWLKKLDRKGAVVRDIDLAALPEFGALGNVSLRFKDALALSDDSVALALDPSSGPPRVLLFSAARNSSRLLAPFGKDAGSIESMTRVDENGLIVLGQKQTSEGLQAALAELDLRGESVNERTFPRRPPSGARSLLTTTSGQRVLVGEVFDQKAGMWNTWLARVNDDFEVLDEVPDEELDPGVVVLDAAAGADGRFAICYLEQADTLRTVSLAEFDSGLKRVRTTPVFSSRRQALPLPCKVARASTGGYFVAGHSLDPALSVAVARVDNEGKIAWRFVEPPSETSYTWHTMLLDLASRNGDYFVLTQLWNPPAKGGPPSSQLGVLHFRQ
jgi:hypothetical protein